MFTFDHPKFKLDSICYHKKPSILKIEAFISDIKNVFTAIKKIHIVKPIHALFRSQSKN